MDCTTIKGAFLQLTIFGSTKNASTFFDTKQSGNGARLKLSLMWRSFPQPFYFE